MHFRILKTILFSALIAGIFSFHSIHEANAIGGSLKCKSSKIWVIKITTRNKRDALIGINGKLNILSNIWWNKNCKRKGCQKKSLRRSIRCKYNRKSKTWFCVGKGGARCCCPCRKPKAKKKKICLEWIGRTRVEALRAAFRNGRSRARRWCPRGGLSAPKRDDRFKCRKSGQGFACRVCQVWTCTSKACR